MSATVFSNTNNRGVISSLLVHRIESGVKPSAYDMDRLRQARDISSARSSRSTSAREPSMRGESSHPASACAAQPPPGCPMHSNDAPTSSSSSSKSPTSFASISGKGPAMGRSSSSSDGCPVPHDQRDNYLKEASSSQQGLNPLNNMPNLSQSAISALQKANLPTERTVSSIPRSPVSAAPGASPYDAPASANACPVAHDAKGKGKADEVEETSKWEYPSPQQFYNALVRKGWETPEENVEMMVLIHNFLNERAWQEVIEWEKLAGTDVSNLQLAKFQGRPGTLSPKARMQGYLALLMPNTYSSEPPFDRHDWIVQRPTSGKSEGELKTGQVRYIIDYYEAPGENPEEDEAVFNLDVRPALDSFESLRLRARKTFQEWGSSEQSQQAQTQAQKA